MSASSSDSVTLRQGMLAATSAYVMWGLLPLYFAYLRTIPAAEMLAHRVIWSLLFGLVILHFRRQWGEFFYGLLHWHALKPLVLTSFLVGANWGIFILAIQDAQIFQASLAYYIVPMLNVLMGVFLLRESLSRLRWLAIALATVGVMILATHSTVFPWYALAMASTFAVYGYVRKRSMSLGVIPSLMIETVLLVFPAVMYLGWLMTSDQAVTLEADTHLWGWILASGPMTMLPLLAFAIGARRLPLSLLGFLQFIAPSLQFGTALVTGETLTDAHLICFTCIWCAAAIFAWDIWRGREKVVLRVPLQ